MRSTASRVGNTLMFVVLDPWIAVLCLTIALTGIAASAGLAVTVVGGALALALTLSATRWIGRLERRRVQVLLGVDVAEPNESSAPRRFGYIGRMIGSRPAWKALAYCILQPIVGTLMFSVTIVFWCAGLALTTLPLFRTSLPGGIAHLGPVSIDNPARTALACFVGLNALFVAPLVTLLSGLADVALVRALLGSSRETELEEQVAEVSIRRTAALDAAEAERRRIERDLHDGAQQRLVALGMTLGLAREKLDTRPEEARALLDEAHAEAKSAMTELRAIARGIHPAVLDDRGLDAALSAVAARCPVPVDISVRLPGRMGTVIEGTAYYVVSEALTNVAKHAGATRAEVDVWVADIEGRPTVIVSVVDDGAGGAAMNPDGGLSGLRDRVAAVGGMLTVTSPVGGPTTLTAEIPR